MSIPALLAKRDRGEPIVVVTAYDQPSAGVAEAAGVDVVLAGDTAAMTVLGYPSTVPVDVEEMLTLTRAVRRGLRTPLLVGDLPFGSYEASDELAVKTAQRFIKEAGCDVVKLERGGSSAECAAALVSAGIPVIGHVGLTPQTATVLGGYRVQGRTADAAVDVADQALELQEAGCFAVVIEAVPAEVVATLQPRLALITIGIGAGPATDGQVLVFNDLLGIYDGPLARFVKVYASVHEQMLAGVREFAADVRTRRFPEEQHCFGIEAAELEAFRSRLHARMAPGCE